MYSTVWWVCHSNTHQAASWPQPNILFVWQTGANGALQTTFQTFLTAFWLPVKDLEDRNGQQGCQPPALASSTALFEAVLSFEAVYLACTCRLGVNRFATSWLFSWRQLQNPCEISELRGTHILWRHTFLVCTLLQLCGIGKKGIN